LLAFIAAGLLLIQFFKRKAYYVILGVFVTSGATIFLLLLLTILIPEFVKLRSAYISGESVVVEGAVQNFHPVPTVGLPFESFSVNGVEFSYNPIDRTPCFHNAPLRNGPIREGLNVRIHYYESCIQRVEVLQEAREGAKSDK